MVNEQMGDWGSGNSEARVRVTRPDEGQRVSIRTVLGQVDGGGHTCRT